jgi:hypothetical protein
MATGSGDGRSVAPGRQGRMRACDDDREQVITDLKTAFVHGRLTTDELTSRAGQALAAQTWADLAALTADLPGGGTAAPAGLARATSPRRQPAPSSRRTPAGLAALWAVLAIPPAAMMAVGFLAHSELLARVAIMTLFVYFPVWLAAGMQGLCNWHDGRNRTSPPPPATPRDLPPETPAVPYRGPLDGLILSEQRPPRRVRPRLA